MTRTPELPAALIDSLRTVKTVGVITGAGVSKESGIPTYRGQGGIYDDPEEGDRTVDALSGPTLERDPDRTWRALAGLARAARGARPNAAHRAIAQIERCVSHFVLLTQNVDGLHRQAGSRNIIEIHGNLFSTRCLVCSRADDMDLETMASLDGAPRCPDCGAALRPQVVLFGENLPEAAFERLKVEFTVGLPDLVLSVGTSALFPYIMAPTVLAANAGKLTVEVNPERTDLSEIVDHFLEGSAGFYMPLIAAALAGNQEKA